MTRKELLKQIEMIINGMDKDLIDEMDEFGYIDSFTYNLLVGALKGAAEEIEVLRKRCNHYETMYKDIKEELYDLKDELYTS